MQDDDSTAKERARIAVPLEKIARLATFDSRLNFLFKIVEDTQNTIRFLDTKAAFCVPLLSAMVAGALQRPQAATHHHHKLFVAFMAGVTITLLVCMRVIFPTIQPSMNLLGSKGPRFYIGHNKAHHWFLHTIRDHVGNVLSETHNSYLAEMHQVADEDLLSSMCDEVLMVALIRQVKSDRLHTALFCLTGTVFLFLAVMPLLGIVQVVVANGPAPAHRRCSSHTSLPCRLRSRQGSPQSPHRSASSPPPADQAAAAD